ncbi:MAG: hypothetical protein HY833_00310 [Candidatus Aenigmarchaeota archaeon]|nr:hypothetical protein [Candidatus Aenigmarchaeota archaeon]
MRQKNGRVGGENPIGEILKQDRRDRIVASDYNESDGLSDFLRKYKPFENGNPNIGQIMKFYDVKLNYARSLIVQKASGKKNDVYSESLYMLNKSSTPQTVNSVSYIMKMGLGKSKDPKDSEIVLALEACRDTFNYINDRSKK